MLNFQLPCLSRKSSLSVNFTLLPSREKFRKLSLTAMGVLAHHLRTLDRSLVPPWAWVKIFQCTCLQSHLKTHPPNSPKSYPKFRITRTTFPEFLEGVKSSYFCYLGPCAKFRNPRSTFGNIPLCAPKYSIVQGVGGVPDWNPNIFVS